MEHFYLSYAVFVELNKCVLAFDKHKHFEVSDLIDKSEYSGLILANLDFHFKQFINVTNIHY